MDDEFDEILELEHRPGLARVAPLAFVLGSLVGVIVAGGVLIYALNPGVDRSQIPAGQAEFPPLFDGRSGRGTGRATADPVPPPPTREAPDDRVTAGANNAAQQFEAPAPGEITAQPLPPVDYGDAASLRGQVNRLESELASAQRQLQDANALTRTLQARIRVIKADLDTTETQLQSAREDAIYNRWLAFVQAAQIRICGDLRRNRSTRCHVTVENALLTVKNRELYGHCLRSELAEPVVREIDRNAAPPDHGAFIDNDDRLTRDWVVVFCDETVPITQDGSLRASN